MESENISVIGKHTEKNKVKNGKKIDVEGSEQGNKGGRNGKK